MRFRGRSSPRLLRVLCVSVVSPPFFAGQAPAYSPHPPRREGLGAERAHAPAAPTRRRRRLSRRRVGLARVITAGRALGETRSPRAVPVLCHRAASGARPIPKQPPERCPSRSTDSSTKPRGATGRGLSAGSSALCGIRASREARFHTCVSVKSIPARLPALEEPPLPRWRRRAGTGTCPYTRVWGARLEWRGIKGVRRAASF